MAGNGSRRHHPEFEGADPRDLRTAAWIARVAGGLALMLAEHQNNPTGSVAVAYPTDLPPDATPGTAAAIYEAQKAAVAGAKRLEDRAPPGTDWSALASRLMYMAEECSKRAGDVP